MQAPGQKRKRSKLLTKAGPLYSLRGERLAGLTSNRLIDWLAAEKKTRPTVAGRAYRLLRACLAWSDEQPEYRGLIGMSRLFTKSVRGTVPESKRSTDVLQREQLALWFKAVRELNNPVMSAYLQAMLLAGPRPNEMARLKWADTDLQWRSLRIGDKVEGDRTIPLPPYMAELIEALPKRNEYVFSSSTAKSGRITDANHRHTRLLKEVGIPQVTLKGLRRSFGTLSEWMECPVGVVAQIQGHKPSALAEKHYRRRPLDLLRLWRTRIEDWILGEAGLEQSSEQANQIATG